MRAEILITPLVGKNEAILTSVNSANITYLEMLNTKSTLKKVNNGFFPFNVRLVDKISKSGYVFDTISVNYTQKDLEPLIEELKLEKTSNHLKILSDNGYSVIINLNNG